VPGFVRVTRSVSWPRAGRPTTWTTAVPAGVAWFWAFDGRASSLPEPVNTRLLASGDQRITPAGIVIIKAQRYRTQERNLADVLARLRELVDAAATFHARENPRGPPAVRSGGASTTR
jgi:hypothetical protein